MRRPLNLKSLFLFSLFLFLLSFHGEAFPAERNLTVAAASDLTQALGEIAAAFEKTASARTTLTFGSTGLLARQVEAGAPFDLFLAADLKTMERLEKGGHIISGTVRPYAQGRIVIAVKKDSGLKVDTLEGLLDPAVRKVAIANPDHAPYGRAAMEALKAAGLWERLKPRLVYGENIRQTLQFVQSGDAGAGIVALSVAGQPEIKYSVIPANLHTPIMQAAGIVRSTRQEALSREFLAFVTGSKGQEILKKYGFLIPGK